MTKEIPTPEAFFLEIPLYTPFEITASNCEQVERIESFKGTLDAYCVECGKESVFKFRPNRQQEFLAGARPPVSPGIGTPKPSATIRTGETKSPRLEAWQKYTSYPRTFPVEFECTRDKGHALYFFVRIQNAEIVKVGQYPSLADLQGVRIGKYRKILGEDKYTEFNRAIGLAAHGVGIGAFVYLRRIFESLLEEAHSKAAKALSWNEDAYEKSRVEEKIKLLRDFLPPFLMENWSIYSILSKGIHELGEQECLEYFEPLRVGIELILDEKIQQLEREKKTLQTQRLISSIRSKLQ